MTFKAVVFDLDGTLVHTAPEYRYNVVAQTLKDLGATTSKSRIDRFWFEARRDEIIKEFFGLTPEVFWKTYRKYDSINLRKQFTKLYDDIDFVQELKKKGFKLGIVTGAPIHIANLEIEMIGRKNFDAIVVLEALNIEQKPNPQGLEKCLKILGVKRSEVIFVGNADEDILTAKNIGVFDVLLARGEHKFPTIKPSLTINSLYELRQLLGL